MLSAHCVRPRSRSIILTIVVIAAALVTGGVWQAPTASTWEDCYTHATLPSFINSARTAALTAVRSPDPRRDDATNAVVPAQTAGPQPAVQELTIVESVHHHDCQALISGDQHRAVVALLGVQQGLLMRNADFQLHAGTAFPVAVYYKRSATKDFAPAGINRTPDARCLFIGLQPRGDPSNEDHWWADLGNCVDGSIPVRPRSNFRTARWTNRNPDFNYLPVVRWHWNDNGNKHSYGVKCGDGWCAFVTGRSKPEPEWATSPCGGDLYPGANDVQPLAMGPGYDLKVRRGAAFFCAEPDLGNWNSPTDFEPMRRVGTVYVTGVPGLYKGLFATGDAPAGGRNEVYLRYVHGLDPDPDKSWLLYVKRPDGTIVRRGVHKGGVVAGAPVATVRWQWHAEDEETWIWCVNGCCSGDGF